MKTKNTTLFGLVEAINCNPNGNPNDDNFPRITSFNSDYKLEISPYAIKRKMRNAWSDMGLNVILDERYRSTTLKQAYEKAFKEFGAKATKKGDEVDLSGLTEEVIKDYIDSVFGIYRDMKVKGIDDELFIKLKKQQLVVSEARSFNIVGDKMDNFRKTLTSHFVSDSSKNEQAGGMGTYNLVNYALFPILMNSQVIYENKTDILKGFVYGFNNNMTATKNFNVFGALIIESDLPLKYNFIKANNPKSDDNLDLEVLETAKGIKVSGEKFINGEFKKFEDKDLYDILNEYVSLYNKR